MILTDRLKEETKTNHQILEKKLIGRMRSMRSAADYTGLLSAFYSYFGGLEMLISRHLDTSILPDAGERRKAGSLAKDLQAFNTVVPELATGTSLPRIQNASQAMGALYVIEGSTLGGQIISQMIRKQLGITTGLTFFESYGERTTPMWLSFKQAVDSSPILNPEELIGSANDTFLKFSEWLDQAF